ncbi:DUF4376 domain-containing protein [Bacteroides thetaiotaomicron]|uniref:DUF4376 domain-containing protein n=1 Tax=Bacteroides thetaiotaomicron TaxID=818 RepID=UPI0039C09412
MKQICKFNAKPVTISDGGYKKGHWIVWLNLDVSEIEKTGGNQSECFQSLTDRLVLSDNSITAFLDVVDSAHIALATTEELEAILHYFRSEDDVTAWKSIRKIQVQGYDSSENVNRFYLGGLPLWLDKATRVGLVNSITIEKNAKRSETCLWFGNYNIKMNIDMALEALSQLELYALDCYNVTAQHLVQIEKCETVDELRSFDISSGYPGMLQFKNEE